MTPISSAISTTATETVRRIVTALAAPVGISLLILISVAHSQDQNDSGSEGPGLDSIPEVVVPGGLPDMVRDAQGERMIVPKQLYEDFERFLREERAASNSNASAEALEQVQVTIKPQWNVARCRVEARATLTSANKRALNIPLGFSLIQAIPSNHLDASPTSFPPIRIANDVPGYVWRVGPGPELHRQLNFDAITNIVSTAQGQTVRIDCPAAPTSIRIELPLGEWDLNMVGAGLVVVEPFRETGGMSVANANTSGGPLTITWSKKIAADQIQAIDLESQTTYSPSDDPGQLRAVCSLSVKGPKSLAGRSFSLKLPKASVWKEPTASPAVFPGYTLTKQTVAPEEPTTLLLKFDEGISRSDVDISIEWQARLEPSSALAVFAIPQVPEVERHSGRINIVVPRGVKFQWEPQPAVQFIKQSQSTDGSDLFTYSFRIRKQTEAVIAQWSLRDQLLNFRANYQVVYDQPQIKLTGAIELVGDIRTLPFLQLDFRGWRIDRIQLQPSGRYIDLAAIRNASAQDREGKTFEYSSVPLSLSELIEPSSAITTNTNSAGPSQADVMPMPSEMPVPAASSSLAREDARVAARSIEFECSQLSNSGSTLEREEISFTLPNVSWLDQENQKRHSACVGGELAIQSSTASLSMAEAIPSLFRPLSLLPSQGNDSGVKVRSELRYRVEESSEWVGWKGVAETSGATIRARANTLIDVDQKNATLSQTWDLHTAGRFPKTLRLAVPKTWMSPIEDDDLAITVDQQPVNKSLIEGAVNVAPHDIHLQALQSKLTWIRIDLPTILEPQNSNRTLKIQIQKRWGLEELNLASRQKFSWTLPQLFADQSSDNWITEQYIGAIQLDENVRGSLSTDPNKALLDTPYQKENGSKLAFDRTQQLPRLDGELFLVALEKTSIDVESVWLQTVLNAVEQRERFVVRFATNANMISIKFPSTLLGESKFLLNGRKANATQNANDGTRFDIPIDSSKTINGKYVLEVFTWPQHNAQWISSLTAQPPTILDCVAPAPLIWQIVIPTNEHLIGRSSSLAPGYRWQWNDLWASRKSEWTQAQIEQHLGATFQPLVSQQTNQYVLLSLDHHARMQVWTAPRYLIWGPIAFCILIAAFLMSEFRWIRKPWIGVVLVLAGMAFSQWAWDLSLAVAQCLIAAMGIAILYGTLKWVVDRRSRRRSVFSSRPATTVQQNSNRSASPSGSSRAMTANTAPPLLATSESGSEPIKSEDR